MDLPEPRYQTNAGRCSCPDFKYRGHLRVCKHVHRLRFCLGYIAQQEAVNRQGSHATII